MLNPEEVVRTLQAASSHGATRRELLSLTAVKMRGAGSPYTGVYLYMLGSDGFLELEAFEGRPTEHRRIQVGTGLCGRAVAELRDIYAPDVTQAPQYLACSPETRSELVVLVRRGREILGQIDVDSDDRAGFGEQERAAVRRVADALASLL